MPGMNESPLHRTDNLFPDFKKKGTLKILKVKFFTSAYSFPLKNTFPEGIEQKSFQVEIRAIFP